MNPVSPVFTDPIAELLGPWAANITIGSILLRLLLSLTLGAIIGWERSNKRHSAGLRTFMLAFLTGSLASLLDSYIFADSGRTGLYILSGATIIGASVIAVHSVFYSSRNQIKGLTTAVGLWVALVIGIALGMGYYTVALTSFAALLCALLWFPALEIAFKNRSNHFEIHLELTNSVSLQDFVTVLRRLGITIDEIEQNPAYVGSGLSVYSISISVSNEMLKKYKSHGEIIDALKTLDYVYHIEEMRS
ncbi:MAG: MgtC/SapB family protein [Clostridia bacterium]|jgi:putative Mg2+ transporter-C (MgtC) family protein|nr:MgtC/SapB family protein [Clostridia bacterium]